MRGFRNVPRSSIAVSLAYHGYHGIPYTIYRYEQYDRMDINTSTAIKSGEINPCSGQVIAAAIESARVGRAVTGL